MAERTITVSSLGKSYSFTGWKIGWATGPPELVGAVRGVKQFLTFAGGTPLQHAAAVARDRMGDEPERLAAALAGKRDFLAAGLGEAGFDVLHTAGTYFLTADAARSASRTPWSSASGCRTRPAWWPYRCLPSPSRRSTAPARWCASPSASARRCWRTR